MNEEFDLPSSFLQTKVAVIRQSRPSPLRLRSASLRRQFAPRLRPNPEHAPLVPIIAGLTVSSSLTAAASTHQCRARKWIGLLLLACAAAASPSFLPSPSSPLAC